MEEHVGDPDSTHAEGEGGDDAPSDYLESLRARFDELASGALFTDELGPSAGIGGARHLVRPAFPYASCHV